ncbi:MAG TPA: O-antigen polysaccharide polymerase Wzy, partial [Sphingopyxis sp.]|nr:O-antigen polysaccharide polymerase Wzy [Sphingopyxis sp.]
VFLSINYLLVRDEFRAVVWEPTSTFEERIDGLGNAIARFTPLSSADEDQLFALDARLNQSLFTGMAVEKLEYQPDTYENGATLMAGLFSFVPRIIWTDKPVRGGSEFITRHTGYLVKGDTTYGIGPFFESYVNFGTWGVFIVCLLFAVLVRWIDLRCYRAMVTGRMTEAVPLAVGALALVQPLSSMASVFSSFYASLIVGFIIAKMLERYLDIRKFAEEQARSRMS